MGHTLYQIFKIAWNLSKKKKKKNKLKKKKKKKKKKLEKSDGSYSLSDNQDYFEYVKKT